MTVTRKILYPQMRIKNYIFSDRKKHSEKKKIARVWNLKTHVNFSNKLPFYFRQREMKAPITNIQKSIQDYKHDWMKQTSTPDDLSGSNILFVSWISINVSLFNTKLQQQEIEWISLTSFFSKFSNFFVILQLH